MNSYYDFSFVTSRNSEIIFGSGAIKNVSNILQRYNASRILIVTDKGVRSAGLVDKVTNLLKDSMQTIVFDKIEEDPKLPTVTEGVELARDSKTQAIIAIGGGSVLDAGKCLASVSTNEGEPEDYWFKNKQFINPKLTYIAIPTTSGTGSEVTKFSVITHHETKLKWGIGNPLLIPEVAILDPDMTVTLPPHITAATGIDALTHALESFVNSGANVFTDMLAVKAMKLIGESLRPAVAKGDNIEARSKMLLGSMLGGMSFGNGYLGLVHALAHPLGGHYGVPHGVANAVLLPKIMKFNYIGNMQKYAKVAEILGENIQGLTLREAAEKSVLAVEKLIEDINIPLNLKEYNIDKEAIPALVEEAIKNRNVGINPRKATFKELELIYEQVI
ncbi:MAG: iron-containing alcohol dehydrogenase [Bacillota bacterium]